MRTLLVVGLLVSSNAHAHIALTSPAPRMTAQKAGPCGLTGSTRGSTVTTYQPGQTITVEWTETVDHPGHYRIAFDDSGDDVFVNPNNPADNFPSTLVEPIADKAGGTYSQQITLPTTPCDDCTLQLMQVMTTSVPYNSFYYQCADIVISGDPGGGGGGDVDGGCSTGAGAGPGVALLALAALRWRRRRR